MISIASLNEQLLVSGAARLENYSNFGDNVSWKLNGRYGFMENRGSVQTSTSTRVRDYECDLQGIVNHATYLNCLEHARHQYLLNLGLNFANLHQRGHSLVVTRCEVDYLTS